MSGLQSKTHMCCVEAAAAIVPHDRRWPVTFLAEKRLYSSLAKARRTGRRDSIYAPFRGGAPNRVPNLAKDT